jgi:hypothetical protein
MIMTKKWIAINLLLLAVASLLGWRLHNSVVQINAANNLSRIQPARETKQKMLQEQILPRPVPKKVYNPAEFAVISDKNLFSDSRSKEEKAEVVTPPEAPPLTQKPILVGITISGDQQLASIIDPASPANQNRGRTQIKRIGDSYSGYIITEITADRIVLQSGTRREIIPLHEGTKRSQSGKTPILATRVVSFGGGASGAAVPAIVSGGTGSVSARPATTIGSVTPVSGTAAQPSPAVGITSQQQSPSTQSGQQQSPGKTRIIKTPFGDIVRTE